MSSKKILVVEDDAISALITTSWLNKAGYAVTAAEDFSSALRLIREDPPHCIVLDLGLPSADPFASSPQDGFALMEWLARIQEQRIPIIVLSAWDARQYKGRALAAGARAFLQKPASKDDLLAAVESALAEPT